MSTRAYFGYEGKKGKIRAIYCHADGYPSRVLPILLDNYKTVNEVKVIVDKGQARYIGTSVEEMEFYHELNDEPLDVSEFKTFKDIDSRALDYTYILRGGVWWWRKWSGSWKQAV